MPRRRTTVILNHLLGGGKHGAHGQQQLIVDLFARRDERFARAHGSANLRRLRLGRLRDTGRFQFESGAIRLYSGGGVGGAQGAATNAEQHEQQGEHDYGQPAVRLFFDHASHQGSRTKQADFSRFPVQIPDYLAQNPIRCYHDRIRRPP